jgi:pimeloyl-ACP methyl ester carboxylesterase
VDAFAPAQGQTLQELLASPPGSCAVPANLTVVPIPGATSGVGDAYVKQSAYPSCMANGLPTTEAHALAATQRPIATSALTQKSGVPAWKTIPSWAVVGTADHAIPPALQLTMARTAHAHLTRVGASHLFMISNPGTVTKVILRAVRATSSLKHSPKPADNTFDRGCLPRDPRGRHHSPLDTPKQAAAAGQIQMSAAARW